MTVYTYAANLDTQDHTERVEFDRTDGSRAAIALGKALDLTSDEVSRLSARIRLSPGGTPTGDGAIGQTKQVYATRNADGTWTSSPPLLGGSTGAINRDSAGRFSSLGSSSVQSRDSAGRVATYSEGGVTFVVARDSQGRAREVATA